MTTTKAKPFLEKLALASDKKSFGLFFFESYLDSDQAQDAFATLNAELPWNLHPTLYGQKLNQHAFEYERFEAKKKALPELNKSTGVAYLEKLCQDMERDFDGTIDTVFCNRFQDPSHQIPWHKDTYGRHILVLSLGSARQVQFRDTKTQEIQTIEPQSGDLYFFPLPINDTHQHRVAPAASGSDSGGTRLSLVFFFRPPHYATAYRISFRRTLRGWFTYFTGIGS